MVITLGTRHVRGIAYGDLLEVEVALDAKALPWPDEEWVALFREYGEFPAELEEPWFEHGKLRFEARDKDLHRAWTAIKNRVDATNRMYGEVLVPCDSAGGCSDDVRRDNVLERLRDAQRLLDTLD
jgi:hypothetical protein